MNSEPTLTGEDLSKVVIQEHEYSLLRRMVKATYLVVGVQGFNILITIAWAKILAVLLGSAMGLNLLFLNTIKLINHFTNFGIPLSTWNNMNKRMDRHLQ